MLPGTGFRYDPRLSQTLSEKKLPQGIIDLVAPGVVEIFPL
jgi:hypothetical protein